MRILPKQYYAYFETIVDTNPTEHLFGVTDNLASIVKSWRASTRISPVWRLHHKYTNDCTRATDAVPVRIIFLSATRPTWLIETLSTECLQALGPNDLWLGVGAHNVIVICYNEDTADEISSVAEDSGTALEQWWIDGKLDGRFKVDSVTPINPAEFCVSASIDPVRSASKAFEQANLPDDDTLNIMILEMYALASVVESRCGPYFPKFRDDVLDMEQVAAQLIPNGELQYDPGHQITDQNKRDLLLSLNAGLSRLASQALSGTTPISQTECHFWPHSLFGTGVANYALRNITEFLTSAILKFQYHQRYEVALKRPFSFQPDDVEDDGKFKISYCNIKGATIAEWQLLTIPLEEEEIEADIAELSFSPNPITFFSGRDGFKNTLLTTSAPLMCISGANCVRWNLGTISHELSHRSISGKLGRLLKSVKKRSDEITSFAEFQNYLRSIPNTMEEYAERLLLAYLSNRVFEKSPNKQKREIKKNLPDLVGKASIRFSREIEEIMVHMFDFYHFYGAESDKYVEYVWKSWAVQPSIVEKMDDYILRTVVALSVAEFRHRDFARRALQDFESICRSASFRDKVAPFVGILDGKINDPAYKENLIGRASRCVFLISIFTSLFRSPELKDYCTRDSFSNPNTRTLRTRHHGDGAPDDAACAGNHQVARADSGIPDVDLVTAKKDERRYKSLRYSYSTKKRHFFDEDADLPYVEFQNPLLFLRDFSRDDDPDAAISAWLLTLLAFNWKHEDREVGET